MLRRAIACVRHTGVGDFAKSTQDLIRSTERITHERGTHIHTHTLSVIHSILVKIMSEVSPPQKRRILFIGNSLTSHRGRSLDHIFRQWGYHSEAKTIGGATLSDIQKKAGPAVLSVISSGSFHAVVLQEDLPEYLNNGRLRPVGIEHLVGPFRKAVAYFTSAIRTSGAVPILYMAHGYERLAQTSHEDICRAHREVSRMLEVAVAPGAIAHKLAEQRVSSTVQCSLPLLEPDGEHPSEEGLYLHAATIDLVAQQALQIEGSCPATSEGEASVWAPSSMEESTACLLREVARDALEEWSEYRARNETPCDGTVQL